MIKWTSKARVTKGSNTNMDVTYYQFCPWTANMLSASQEISFFFFMEAERSLLCSQLHPTNPYPEPHWFLFIFPPPYFFKIALELFSRFCFGIPNDLFHSGAPTETLFILFSPTWLLSSTNQSFSIHHTEHKFVTCQRSWVYSLYYIYISVNTTI